MSPSGSTRPKFAACAGFAPGVIRALKVRSSSPVLVISTTRTVRKPRSICPKSDGCAAGKAMSAFGMQPTPVQLMLRAAAPWVGVTVMVRGVEGPSADGVKLTARAGVVVAPTASGRPGPGMGVQVNPTLRARRRS